MSVHEVFWYKVHRQGISKEYWEIHGPFSTPSIRDKAIKRRVLKDRVVKGSSYVTYGMLSWEDEELSKENCKDDSERGVNQGKGS